MPRPVAYKTGSIQPPNTAKQSNILVGVAPSNWGAGAANATFYNSLDSSYQYVIVKNSSVPAMWGTGDFTTSSLLTTINGLPERVGQTRFTDATTAISWSLASGNYTILKNEQPYGGPVINGLALGFNAVQKNLFVNGNFADGTRNPFYWDYGSTPTVIDISNDKPYVGSQSTKALQIINGGCWMSTTNLMEVGKTYTFSFWARKTDGTSGTIGNDKGPVWNNQNGSGELNSFSYPWNGTVTPTTTIDGTWRKYNYTFTYSAARTQFYFYGVVGTTIFTEFQIEEGSTSTTFSSFPSFTPQNAGLINSSSLSLNNGGYWGGDKGGTYILDGVDDYIATGQGFDQLGMGNNSYTAEILYYRSSSNAADQTLFGVLATGTSNGLHLILRGNYPYFGHYSADTSATIQTMYGYFHVAFVFEKTSNMVGNQLIYINGALNATGTSKAALNNTNAYPVNIGGQSYWGNYAGNIYLARIYNRALSASEIENLYNASLPLIQPSSSSLNSNLVLYLDASNPNSYPGSGTTWTDISGYGNDFTLVNSPTFNTGNGGYLQFDGVDDYAYLAVNSSISVGLACSLEMVVKNNYAMRMGQGGSYWAYGFEGAGFAHTSGPQGNISPYFDGNAFHHYVFIWNQAQNNHTMYKDGVPVYSFSPVYSFAAGGGGYFVLGGARGNTNFVVEGAPHIAMLRLYNKVLTSAEVQQNFNSIKAQFGL